MGQALATMCVVVKRQGRVLAKINHFVNVMGRVPARMGIVVIKLILDILFVH